MHEAFFLEVLDKGSPGVPDGGRVATLVPPQDAYSAGRERHARNSSAPMFGR